MKKFQLITGRTVKQGIALHIGKTTESYQNAVAVAYLNKIDMDENFITEGKNILLSTDFGRVVVKALKDDIPKGMIFMPYSPWANLLISMGTHGTGMPDFKSLIAWFSPVDEEVWSWEKVLKEVKTL